MKACEDKIKELGTLKCDPKEFLPTEDPLQLGDELAELSDEESVYGNIRYYRNMVLRTLLSRDTKHAAYGGQLDVFIIERKQFAKTDPERYRGAVLDYSEGRINTERKNRTERLHMFSVSLSFVPMSARRYQTYLEQRTREDKYFIVSDTLEKWESKLEDVEKESIGHANALVLDHTMRTADFYEPHGKHAPWLTEVIRLVKRFVSRKFSGYRTSHFYADCAECGIQAKANDARCANWASLYMYLRGLCPSQSGAVLQQYILSKSVNKLRALQHGWSCYLLTVARDQGYIDLWQRLKNEEELAQDRYERETSGRRQKFLSARAERALERLSVAAQTVHEFQDGNYDGF